MVDHRDPDPALTDGKGFPLKMFAPTVTEIELTTVRSMTLDMHAHFTHVRNINFVHMLKKPWSCTLFSF